MGRGRLRWALRGSDGALKGTDRALEGSDGALEGLGGALEGSDGALGAQLRFGRLEWGLRGFT